MQYAMDRNVGKILAALDDPDGNPETDDGIADNTLVVFINDNGGDCCDVGPNSSDNGDLRNGKGSQFEGGMRVPMIVAGAGIDNSQIRHCFSGPWCIRSISFPRRSSVLVVGHLRPGEVIDGVNLLPYINDTVAGVAHEDLFISRYNNQQSAVRMGKWKYMYQNGTGYQLYDLDADIDESNNVAGNPANASVVEQAHQLLASYHVQMDKPRHDNQAPETNQFDHFRFREDNFVAANFSTSSAWTNGDTGSGSFTASWRDGYANNVLTFRTKATGDYTVTNDLDAAAGFAYMTSKINLITHPTPLSAAHTGTVGGLPVLMTKNLSGDGPEINLDATDATAGVFSFHVDLDIEVYDDLTIRGDGNQNFAFGGEIREFRDGRSITKTGSADAEFAGPISVTGTVDLQGGKVSLIDGTVGGHLVARSGVIVSVGGGGFNRTIVTPPNPTPIVTDGLDLHYDAVLDFAGDATWDDVAGSASNLSFGALVLHRRS